MIKVALAGQPNCGKSTIFNMVSGIKQHIANYPGVTVDKKSGYFSYKHHEIEIVDLPGTYSFSSYSLEEKIAKEVILYEDLDLIINIVDASNLKRNLYLTFQLLEIAKPTIIVLNMMDVAKNRGLEIDCAEISKLLGCHVIEASGAKGIGKDEILEKIVEVYESKDKFYSDFKINYEELEPFINELESKLIDVKSDINRRWLAIKSLEGDSVILDDIKKSLPEIEEIAKEKQRLFHERYDKDIEGFLATYRYDSSDVICHKTMLEHKKGQRTFTDIIDNVILSRWFAFPILFLVIVLVYELSIVFGYKLTNYTWPYFAAFKNFVISFLPPPDLSSVPLFTDFVIWMINSTLALLNYLPIFLILFALIAILEDVGYMPRIAFILDRIFRKFGLHGQSTLPLVLGGAFVGGCAVPGIMSTKGIADDRARMATIMTVPLMNCLAKVPFYTLILGAFFEKQMSIMMFYISTITIFIALIVAKFLTSTVLKTRQTAPFVMELPPYHLPTIKGVLLKALERVWMYIKKVVTIVLAVAIVLFVLLQYPGLSTAQIEKYNIQTDKALAKFDSKVKSSKYYSLVDEKVEISKLLNLYDSHKSEKMTAGAAGGKVDEKYEKLNKDYFVFLKPKNDKDAKDVNVAVRALSKDINKILRDMKNDRIESSLLGMAGRALEPLTQFAGFDWKVNVSFLSAFAARESAVATLGSIYESNKTDKNLRPEEAMAQTGAYTPLHAVSLLIFMILTPPCIASMIVVKMETHAYRWMLITIFFPIFLGLVASSLIFTIGKSMMWSGLEAMSIYYFIIFVIVAVIAIFPQKNRNWSGGYKKLSSVN